MTIDSDDLPSFTASQLELARANDFVRFCALLTKYAGDPNAVHLAIRNYPVFYPRSLHRGLFVKAAVASRGYAQCHVGLPAGSPSTVGERVSGPAPAADAHRADSRSAPGAVQRQRAGADGRRHVWLDRSRGAGAVTKSDFASVTLAGAKAGGIVVLTEELVEAARESPSAVAVMREEMINGVGGFLDVQFQDPAIAAVANVSPASITNGAGNSVSCGHVAANAVTDIQTLISAFVAANPSRRKHGAVDEASQCGRDRSRDEYADAGVEGRIDLRNSGGGVGHGGRSADRVDASQILIADDGGLDVDMSNNALVQLDSSPADPTVAGTVLIPISDESVGLRITRFINWKRAQTTAVRYISAAAYV